MSGRRTDFGTLPRPAVGKHKSTAADAADDVKRREVVYREGLAACRQQARRELYWELINFLEGNRYSVAARRVSEAANAEGITFLPGEPRP